MYDENSTVNPSQGEDLSNLQNMFADYHNRENSKKKKTKEEILAKYFVPRKDKELFRILPPKAGKKHIEEAYFHVVTTLISGGKTKFNTVVYCPALNNPKVPKLDANGNEVKDNNGNVVMVSQPCPICAKYNREIAKQDPSIKMIKKENMTEAQKKIKESNDKIYKDAYKWKAKKFYILRGIDRGAEKDGVKFWRFKENFKKEGVFDKLLPILEEYMSINKADFASPVNGTDLSILMVKKEFNGKPYMGISAISTRGKSPLHTDKSIEESWLNDPITWKEVYTEKKAPNITSYQYLEMIVNGNNPYFDESDPQNKHWVFPGNPELEKMANTRNTEHNQNEEYISEPDSEEDYDGVNINNVNNTNVGTYTDNAVDLSRNNTATTQPSSNNEPFDDLPF